MQRVALSGAEETEQQDPETIHLTRQRSLGKKYRPEKSPRTYTLIATSVSFSMLILPLTLLPVSGALNVILWYSKQL